MTVWDEIRQEWRRDLPDVIEGRDPMALAQRRANGLEPLGSITDSLMEKLARARKGAAA